MLSHEAFLRPADTLSRNKPRRREGTSCTVGLLVDELEDDYQNAILQGVTDAAREKGANLLCFTGGVLKRSRRAFTERNAVYDLVSPESVDGLLIMAGALGNTIGMVELSRYCERFRPLPTCSIAVAVDTFPCVLIDNTTGMAAAVEHLIKVHGYRRVAFIRGPEANSEAERRYRVYKDVLTRNDILLSPSLVVAGNFQRSAGADAVRALLDERRVEVDAIIAANDGMALGAIEALHARGARVPEDIAVIGFDDIEEARISTPPLTTVRQPLYEQGRRATQILIERMDGRAGSERVILRTELVTRRSCGCLPRAASARGAPGPAPPPRASDPARPERASNPAPPPRASEPAPLPDSLDAALAAARDGIIEAMARAARSTAPDHDAWAERLLDAFLADLEDPSKATFLAACDALVRAEVLAGGDGDAWQDILSAMRRLLLPLLAPSAERHAIAEDLWHEARISLGSAAVRAQASQRVSSQRFARVLGEIGTAFITAFDLDTLTNTIAAELPRLGITSCYLSLYEGERASLETSRLLLAYDAAAEAPLRPADPVFPSRRLAPDGLLPLGRRSEMIVEPLFFKEEHLGFVLFEMGPRSGVVYEILRDQLSAALKGALLVKQVAEKEREQRRLLVDLEKRAFQLERAQEALKENQARLVTARSAAKEAMRLASNAAERASNFTRTGRPSPRDSNPGEIFVPFNTVPCIREALGLLGNVLRHAGCRVSFEPASESIELLGAPARFAQIVTNLVMNAIDACLAKDGGLITVTLARRDATIKLTVTDAGAGIAPELLPRIFDPPVRGAGQAQALGLSTAHEIVTSEFRGTITVESKLGAGSTFTVLIPARDSDR
jgi:DNA-binding LacI/PurR family transcriptional regulator/signal transduction histidine kinase